MSNFVYLITKDDIEWLDNYDEKKIQSVIRDVQRAIIRPIFPSYYEYLLEKVENNNKTKQDEYILDEYITPMMSLLCENEFISKGSLKLTNTGANIETGEDFERHTSSEKGAIITRNDGKVEVFKADMISYMTTNKALFPEFKRDYDCLYMEYEETFNMSTIHGSYRKDTIYGSRSVNGYKS